MPRLRDTEPKNIRLSGPEWWPPGYATSPLDERRWFWKTLADIAIEVKRDEVARGIGITGRKLKPVKPRSRPDGAKGEPLDPHDTDSRTYKLLAGHVMVDGVTLFWRPDKGKSWSTILGYHAYKHGPRSLPVRNTIGISRGGKTKIRKRAFAAWAARQSTEKPKREKEWARKREEFRPAKVATKIPPASKPLPKVKQADVFAAYKRAKGPVVSGDLIKAAAAAKPKPPPNNLRYGPAWLDPTTILTARFVDFGAQVEF